MRQGISQRAYARHRGVTHGAVQKAVATHRITPLPDGSIDCAAADRDWARNTDETKPRNSVSGDPKHRRRPGEPPQPAENKARLGGKGNGNGEGDPSAYTVHRAEREQYVAGLARLEYEQRIRTSLKAEDVRHQLFAASRQLRDQLLSVAERLAPAVIGQRDPESCRSMLDAEMRRIATDLQQALQAVLEEGLPT